MARVIVLFPVQASSRISHASTFGFLRPLGVAAACCPGSLAGGGAVGGGVGGCAGSFAEGGGLGLGGGSLDGCSSPSAGFPSSGWPCGGAFLGNRGRGRSFSGDAHDP